MSRHTRAVVTEPPTTRPVSSPAKSDELEPLSSLLGRRHADIEVAARPLSDYDAAAITKGGTR